ncbi:YjcZ-like family protein [Sphaerospermopsis torques-reginae]|uniref:YjcZ-like family protein n=1 Tax=Sphaerospermopsis torques-reginae ITEP-024 TaxID=984208 RepID=A0ABX8X379_9CYAN|nr:YjcZ-like family protein [Sphaerospermopsis torques-reginae]QYX33147.1 YjcZ-like family protein [Sphaerospermopsis torques-reginae ITEP-024]
MSLIYFNDLQKKIPIITDKILVDLVNLIQVNDDLISFRQKQGLFEQFFDNLTGADRNRELAIDKNVNVAMQSLHSWVLDIANNLNVSNNAIITIEEKLIETRQAIRNQRQDINLLTDIVDQLKHRVDDHEHRILELEQRVYRTEVDVKIGKAIAAWQSKETYQGFHWAIQVAFVTREIVDYALGDYERFITKGKDSQLRQSISNRILVILAADNTIPDHHFPLTNLLNLSYSETSPDNQKYNQKLAAYLLEVESISEQRLGKTPYLFTLGKTLELATQQQHQDPAKAAFELCRKYPNVMIYPATSKREFVERIVNETANDRLNLIIL